MMMVVFVALVLVLVVDDVALALCFARADALDSHAGWTARSLKMPELA